MAEQQKENTVDCRTEEYKQRFKDADVNGDGYLSIFEFYQMMRAAGSKMTDRQIAETFVFFDGPQGDRAINFDEFCIGCERIRTFELKVRQLFKELDTSGDGQLQKEELKTLLDRSGRAYTAGELDAMFREVDQNGDKSISYQEFIQYFS